MANFSYRKRFYIYGRYNFVRVCCKRTLVYDIRVYLGELRERLRLINYYKSTKVLLRQPSYKRFFSLRVRKVILVATAVEKPFIDQIVKYNRKHLVLQSCNKLILKFIFTLEICMEFFRFFSYDFHEILNSSHI